MYMKEKLEKMFRLKENGTTVKTEVLAGGKGADICDCIYICNTVCIYDAGIV